MDNYYFILYTLLGFPKFLHGIWNLEEIKKKKILYKEQLMRNYIITNESINISFQDVPPTKH